jgi:coenzyme F420-dependent glucose-6-phosphate dehydrogenase
LKRNVEAFQRGGGEGKPLYLQTAVSYAGSREEALHAAYDQWRVTGLDPTQLADIRTPRYFDEAAQRVSKDTVAERVRLCTEMSEFCNWLHELAALGFTSIYLNHVGTNVTRFIDAVGERLSAEFN